MSFLYFILGIVLVVFGIWITIYQMKNEDKDQTDALGLKSRFFFLGIGCIAGGTLLIMQIFY